MNPFFSTPARVETLQRVAQAWVGTPFALHAAIRGAGVDCVRFAAEVLRECGHMESYNFPAYTLDGGDHLKASLVEQWLRANPLFVEIPLGQDLQPGDVLEFNIGRGVAHHVGIYAGSSRKQLWSAAGNDGVRVRTLRDSTWSRRLARAWRPLETKR